MIADATPIRLAVLISGNGSNLQAIIDASESDALPATVAVVISNEPDAYGLERGRRAGIETRVLDHRDYTDRESYDRDLISTIDQYRVDLVILAGFMRILSDTFVEHYSLRAMNIHPSLLPKYRGLDTHARAIAASDAEHGASVHFVTGELDGGPLIIQHRVPILPDDTPDILQQRVHRVEHQILPQAIRWFAENRLTVSHGHVLLDGEVKPEPRY